MLKDDRMMGMLTFVVIMLALGTMVQRAEFFQRLFGTGEPVAAVLNADAAEARVNERATIDVLANDRDVADASALTITTRPECGSASVSQGTVRYTPTSDCLGRQSLRYGLGAEGPSAEVVITVRPAEEPDGKLRTVIRPGVPETTITAAGPEAGSDAGPAAAQSSSETAGPAASGDTFPPVAPAAEAPAGGVRMSARGDERAGSAGTGTPAAAAPAGDGAGAGVPGQRCTLPPTVTLEARPAAVTEVIVDSPCDRDGVAELAYDGLRFAIPLNFRGAGSLEVPGLQRSTEATIAFGRGGEMAFNLPFDGIERIDRVAIAWEGPSVLALNAFEFGARPGAQGHLTPDRPGSFEAVRREGGGWLASYEPEGGKGERIDVYSFWRRHAGPSGVVRLALDPSGAAGSGACGGHPGAAAGGSDYVVLRSTGGQLERSRLGRIAPLDCTVLAENTGRYIENAVDDLIVRRR